MDKYELTNDEIHSLEHVVDDYSERLNDMMNDELPWSDSTEKRHVLSMARNLVSVSDKLNFESIGQILKDLLVRLEQIEVKGPGFIVEE